MCVIIILLTLKRAYSLAFGVFWHSLSALPVRAHFRAVHFYYTLGHFPLT